MKKSIIIIALIFLIAAGSVGVLYATGNLKGIVDKVFNRSEIVEKNEVPKTKEREIFNEETIQPEETTQIKLYFSNNEIEDNCQSNCPVIRAITVQKKEIEEIAKIAIIELLKGPTKEEGAQGYYLTVGIPSKENIERHKERMEEKQLDTSAFGDGIEIKSLEVRDGVAHLDFNISLNVDMTNECIITTVKNSIIYTLKQFSEIKEVIVTVEGVKFPYSNIKMLDFEIGKTDIFVEIVQSGEGVTHLARRALDKYLNQVSYVEEIELTETQKIYAEDYLQNKIGSKSLEVGESVEFSADLIKEAIDSSQHLLFYSQQNLEKYLLSTSVEAGAIQDIKEDSVIIWMRYLNQSDELIPDARVILSLVSPDKHEYETKFSEEDNYYYTTLYFISRFKNSYCFQMDAEKEIYIPQHKYLGCVKFSECGTDFRFPE